MVGGRSYRESPFNRVTQAKRQPGSTFKLFVYLAALRAGYTPGDAIEDRPLRIGNWSPENYESKYQGVISLRDAFAASSNVAAVRLSETVGRERVLQAARDLGVTSELEKGPTVALGTSTMSLMELTGAFASVAKGDYPVKPRGLPEAEEAFVGTPFEGSTRRHLLELLSAVTRQGTGRGAALAVPTFGKTGTSQNSRDAYFVGFAGDLVTGVWIGHDDNRPVGEITGGGVPAQIWRGFMAEAVKNVPVPETPLVEESSEVLPPLPDGTAPAPSYDVQDYDVEGAADAPLDAPLPEGDPVLSDPLPAPGEPPLVDPGPAPAPPSTALPAPRDAPPPAAAAPRPRENAPAPRRREIPTITPPPPPAPKEEAPPEDDASPKSGASGS
jgi:penicillin-binding protein 1A